MAITDTLTLSDIDDTQLDSATVSIIGNFATGEDVLNFADQSGITGSYDSLTGILSLTGTASIADYQTALRSVSYENTSDDPSALSRTVSFTINDGALDSNSANRAIVFTAVNDAPVLAAIEGAATSYTENDTPLVITSTLALSDVDDVNLESATVAISGNFTTGEDVLIFTDQSGITGSYDALSGILTLTGSASIADYQTALRSVTYFNSSEDPSDLTRTISFTINDGDVDSNICLLYTSPSPRDS